MGWRTDSLLMFDHCRRGSSICLSTWESKRGDTSRDKTTQLFPYNCLLMSCICGLIKSNNPQKYCAVTCTQINTCLPLFTFIINHLVVSATSWILMSLVSVVLVGVLMWACIWGCWGAVSGWSERCVILTCNCMKQQLSGTENPFSVSSLVSHLLV